MSWLEQLIQIPFVSILSANGAQAHLEVGGFDAHAHESEFGLCIGVRMPDSFSDQQTHQALLQLASAELTDDGLMADGSGFVLWRRYWELEADGSTQIAALKKRLEGQLAIVRHLIGPEHAGQTVRVNATDFGSLA